MNKLLLLLAALFLFGCAAPEPDLDELAREYLFLELSMALHDEAQNQPAPPTRASVTSGATQAALGSPGWTQAVNAFSREIRCASPCSTRKSSAR